MANVPAAMKRLHQIDQQSDSDQSLAIDRHESEYEEILQAVDDYADESLFGEVTEWMIETTRSREVPSPTAVRERARTLCAGQGIIVPANSPLRD